MQEAGTGDKFMDNWPEVIQSAKSLNEALRKLPSDERSFKEWADQLMGRKHIAKSDVVKNSGLNPTFAYQILSEQRRAKRDKLLQLAFAMELDIETSSELLERGGVNALSPRTKRDVVIAYCLSHGISLNDCDEILYRAGQPTIQQGYPAVKKY